MCIYVVSLVAGILSKINQSLRHLLFSGHLLKFIDLSYYAQSCLDAMRALQHCLPRMHDDDHWYDVGGKLNNECSTLLFSPFNSFVS